MVKAIGTECSTHVAKFNSKVKLWCLQVNKHNLRWLNQDCQSYRTRLTFVKFTFSNSLVNTYGTNNSEYSKVDKVCRWNCLPYHIRLSITNAIKCVKCIRSHTYLCLCETRGEKHQSIWHIRFFEDMAIRKLRFI